MTKPKKASTSKRGRKDAHGNTIMPDDPRYLPKRRKRDYRWNHEPTPGQKRQQAKHETYVNKAHLLPDRAMGVLSDEHEAAPVIPEDFFDATPAQKAVRTLVRALIDSERQKIDQARRFQAEIKDQALQFDEQLAAADDRYNRFTAHANKVIQDLRAQLNPVEPKTATDGFDNSGPVGAEGWRAHGSIERAIAKAPPDSIVEVHPRDLKEIAAGRMSRPDLVGVGLDKQEFPRPPWYRRAWRWLW